MPSASDIMALCEILLLQSVIKTFKASGLEYAVDDIIKYRTGSNRVFILAFMQEQIDCLRRCSRYDTAKNYEHTIHNFS